MKQTNKKGNIIECVYPKLKQEAGQIFFSVMILLMVGSVIIVGLLSFVSSGYKTSIQVYSEKADELYAADAGIRDAMWNIQHKTAWVPTSAGISDEQNIGTINGKTVQYTVEKLPDGTYQAVAAYQIVVTATDDSHTTTITTNVNIVDFQVFTDNAITSPSLIDIGNHDKITGDIHAPSIIVGNKVGITGDIDETEVIGWPQLDSNNDPVCRYYYNQVSSLTPHTSTTINIASDSGPLYVDNGNSAEYFNLQGSGDLDGTIFVDGNLDVPNGAVINLNNQTIFVTGNLKVWPNSEIDGPGAIIAVGSMDYQPSVTNGQYIYLMSVIGEINFQPLCNFTGSLAGNTTINLQPGVDILWSDPTSLNLNLPGQSDTYEIGSIYNWQIE